MLHTKAIADGLNDDNRSVDLAEWRVPAYVEIKEGRIYWKAPFAEGSATKSLLPAFMRLGDATEKSVLNFVKKFGILQLCKHNLPKWHQRIVLDQMNVTHAVCNEAGWYEGKPYESIDAWRAFAREAQALVKVADRVIWGKTGDPLDWKAVYERTDPTIGLGLAGKQVETDRILIGRIVGKWIDIAGVRPIVEWRANQKHPTIKLGGGGLFGAIAIQLALAVGQASGFAICHHCGRQYPLNRKPKTGQRRFCSECRDAGIPQRYSLADWRRRSRKGK